MHVMLRRVFLGPDGLRSGWRILLWILAAYLLSLPLQLIPFLLFGMPKQGNDLAILATTAFSAVGFFAATWLFVRFLDRRPIADAGYPRRHAGRDLAVGLALGAGGILVALAFDLVRDGASWLPGDPRVLPFAGEALLLFGAAAWEEMFFRGYAYDWLTRGLGVWPATILTALIFALAHAGNEHVDLFALALIFLSGLWLALLRATTRSLWGPFAMHFGWNFAQGMLLGLPISGFARIESLLHVTLAGPVAWTGGDFGLEATPGAFVGIGLGLVGIVWIAWRRGKIPRGRML